MRVLFEPGIAVMGRLPNQQKLPLISTLFILPLAILYYETHAQLPTTVALLVSGTVSPTDRIVGKSIHTRPSPDRLTANSMRCASDGTSSTAATRLQSCVPAS